MSETDFSASNSDIKHLEKRISGQAMDAMLVKPVRISANDMYLALASPDQGADEILQWLLNDGRKLDPDRYIFFLETMMGYVLECWDGSPSREKGLGMIGVLEEMIAIYTETIKPSFYRKKVDQHFGIWSKLSRTLQTQVQLLADGYAQYLDQYREIKASKRNISKSIEEQDVFRSAKLVDIRHDFINYDKYFDDIEGPIPFPKSFPEEFPDKIGQFPLINPKISINQQNRKKMISLCAKIVNEYPESKSLFDLEKQNQKR